MSKFKKLYEILILAKFNHLFLLTTSETFLKLYAAKFAVISYLSTEIRKMKTLLKSDAAEPWFGVSLISSSFFSDRDLKFHTFLNHIPINSELFFLKGI